MTTFLLIRHAVTDITGKILTGRLPGFHLDETGRAQARAVGDRHASSGIDVIYSSPLERAIETATPLAERLGLHIEQCEAFTEVDCGRWSGLAIQEIQALDEWKRFNRSRGSARPPGGESIIDLQHRTIPEINRLRQVHPDQTVAIFSHGDPIRATMVHFLGMPGDFVHRLEVSPASTSVVEMHEDAVRVLAINREC